MNFKAKGLPILCALVASSTVLPAQTQPAASDKNTPLVAELARRAEWNVRDNALAVLARRDLADADRKRITAILEQSKVIADKLVAQAGEALIPASVQEFNALREKYEKPVQAEYKSFMTPRGDLDWMRGRADGIQAVEDPMILAATHEYLDLAADAGIDKARQDAIAKLLDKCRAELAARDKLITEETTGTPVAGWRLRTLEYLGLQVRALAAARSAIRNALSDEQVAALEWQFLRTYNGIPTYATLGYSTQGQAFTAPQDGSYVLETHPDRNVLGKVALKKGQPMGFHKKGDAQTAFGGDKDFVIPPGATVNWKLAEE